MRLNNVMVGHGCGNVGIWNGLSTTRVMLARAKTWIVQNGLPWPGINSEYIYGWLVNLIFVVTLGESFRLNQCVISFVAIE